MQISDYAWEVAINSSVDVVKIKNGTNEKSKENFKKYYKHKHFLVKDRRYYVNYQDGVGYILEMHQSVANYFTVCEVKIRENAEKGTIRVLSVNIESGTVDEMKQRFAEDVEAFNRGEACESNLIKTASK